MLQQGLDTLDGDRLKSLLECALQVNKDRGALPEAQTDTLRRRGLMDEGVVQLTHIVSDLSSCNTLNLALNTDFDYRDPREELAVFTASN